MRVVSLVPSVTETLVAWGVQPVAVTRFCQQPQLQSVGGTKNPHIARIVALAPDVVIVDKEENRAEDATALEEAGIGLHVTHVTSLADVGPLQGGRVLRPVLLFVNDHDIGGEGDNSGDIRVLGTPDRR